MALFVLCGVIVAVFLEVAKFARTLNFVGYIDASARGEVVKLGL
jgi:hypothetical protein